jgi:putative ABC transport system permease protein
VKYHKRGSGSVSVIGTTELYLFTSGVTLADGRFLSAAECDSGRPVCVIGSDLGTNLFRNEEPVGEKILIAKHEFEVVGVLEKQGGFSDSGGADNSAIVPLQQYLYTFDRNPDYEVQVKVKSLDQTGRCQGRTAGRAAPLSPLGARRSG